MIGAGVEDSLLFKAECPKVGTSTCSRSSSSSCKTYLYKARCGALSDQQSGTSCGRLKCGGDRSPNTSGHPVPKAHAHTTHAAPACALRQHVSLLPPPPRS